MSFLMVKLSNKTPIIFMRVKVDEMNQLSLNNLTVKSFLIELYPVVFNE